VAMISESGSSVDTMAEKQPAQLPADELPDKLWDVLVVGAGPAGSTAAFCLASLGHEVLLLDAKRFPREKVCGDGLIPDTLRCLRRLGLFEAVRHRAHSLDNVVISSPNRTEIRLPGELLTLRREVFDHLLAAAAVAKGACFGLGRVTGLSPMDSGGVRAEIGGGDSGARARLAILATGAEVSLARKLGLITRQRPTAVAGRHYVRSNFKVAGLVIAYDRSIVPGYAWIFPVGDGEYNIGCGQVLDGGGGPPADLRAMLETFETEYPLARALMAGKTAVTPFKGGALRCGLQGAALCGDKVLAIGETIGATFPFTGEGVGKAMETGELAASVAHEALASDRADYLRAFEQRIEEQVRPRYLGYTAAQKYLSMPWLNNLVIWRASRSRYLGKAFSGIVEDSVDPREVFSIKGLWKSLWG